MKHLQKFLLLKKYSSVIELSDVQFRKITQKCSAHFIFIKFRAEFMTDGFDKNNLVFIRNYSNLF